MVFVKYLFGDSDDGAAQRPAVQLPQARCSGFYQKTGDRAREAVSWNFYDRTQSLLTRATVATSNGCSETACY
jgi:hypothetical protein